MDDVIRVEVTTTAAAKPVTVKYRDGSVKQFDANPTPQEIGDFGEVESITETTVAGDATITVGFTDDEPGPA